MTYKETLERAKRFGISAWQLLAANEVDCQFEGLSDEEFELLSDFVYDWLMDTSMSVDELCYLIKSCLDEKVFTIEDIRTNYKFVKEKLNERI